MVKWWRISRFPAEKIAGLRRAAHITYDWQLNFILVVVLLLDWNQKVSNNINALRRVDAYVKDTKTPVGKFE